ncbi:MAG: hypothetical protein MI920_13010 [Kiloniellales bacterium]|nr:hypothetical protein [Kiloniellales bacterium]
MALRIETFSNTRGGNAFFKAVGHPLAARKAPDLLAELTEAGPVAIYDPLGHAADFAQLYDLGALSFAGYFVQDLDDLDKSLLGQPAQPVTALPESGAARVLVAAFNAERLIAHIQHLLPAGAEILSLDPLRLPEAMLTRPRDYLSGLNFATNFAFFRDAEGAHTRVVTADYWSGYGAAQPALWCCLFDEAGAPLAEWQDSLPGAGAAIVIDSAEVRRRFGLGPFTGQLFLHVTGIAGHDVVKYALDTYGDEAAVLSCTHDANAWPSDHYAGLPAPRADERVLLWVQNSHPAPIPAGGLGLNLMGREPIAWLDREIPAFATYALDTRELLPEAAWPQQIELQAGKHVVRPRYEVIAGNGRTRIAHVNVERSDLKPNARIPEIANLLGKGYILPAPLLPPQRFDSIVLPTPMATRQANLPITALLYDADGREVASQSFGCLPRDHATALDLNALLAANGGLSGPNGGANGGANGEAAWGHVELVYDFREGGEADGWLHAIFRYEDKRSGHSAETSFGAHMFNSVLTYKGEPQSYAGRAPGLSTRLFLRLGPQPLDSFCHLIYAASTPWHDTSDTTLTLHDLSGAEIAERRVAIPCGGSLLWRASEMFESEALARVTDGGYVMIRDVTCRLFGYHGLMHGETSFSLDHMFGF